MTTPTTLYLRNQPGPTSRFLSRTLDRALARLARRAPDRALLRVLRHPGLPSRPALAFAVCDELRSRPEVRVPQEALGPLGPLGGLLHHPDTAPDTRTAIMALLERTV